MERITLRKKHITAATLARVLHLESQKFFLESHEEHGYAQNTPSKPSLSTHQHRRTRNLDHRHFLFYEDQPRNGLPKNTDGNGLATRWQKHAPEIAWDTAQADALQRCMYVGR